jgi:general secretion pathway protein C
LERATSTDVGTFARSQSRRGKHTLRAAVLIGATAFLVAVLWRSGKSPDQWLAAMGQWWSSPPSESVTARRSADKPVTSATETPASTSSAAGTDSSVSPTPRPLFLVSTSPGRTKQDGTAVLGTSRHNPQTYFAGAVLANGARLAEIHADRVVLSRDGKAATLYLDRPERNPGMMTDLSAVGGQPEPQVPVPTMTESLAHYIRPSPVYDGDVIRGYEVYAGKKSAVFSRLGLQNGDVITRLDDVPFSDPQQAIDMFRRLTNGETLVATLDRKGARVRLTLDGALIVDDQERMRDESVASVPSSGPSVVATH